MLLPSTAKDIVSKEGNDMIYKSNTRYIVNQVKGTLEKIIEENDNHETNSQKKDKELCKRRPTFNRTVGERSGRQRAK